MQIRTTEHILDYDGRPFPLHPASPQLTTIRDVVQMALNNVLPNEVQTKEQKADFFRLTQLVYSDAVVELTPIEAEIIEARAGELLSALVYCRLQEIFARQSLTALAASNGSAPVAHLADIGEPNGDG